MLSPQCSRLQTCILAAASCVVVIVTAKADPPSSPTVKHARLPRGEVTTDSPQWGGSPHRNNVVQGGNAPTDWDPGKFGRKPLRRRLKENAGNIKCKISCELANGPTTPEADEILYNNGVLVLPDFLANAGGVTVSYFEQVQNTYNYYWSLEMVHERLDEKMTKAYHAVNEMYVKHKVNMRKAAYLVSVARVAEACKLRGWV